MAKFVKKPVIVDAVQLLWSNWSEVCELAGVGKYEDGKPEGCYVHRTERAVVEDSNGRIGLRFPVPNRDYLLAVEGDWIVRLQDRVFPVEAGAFAEQFEPMGHES